MERRSFLVALGLASVWGKLAKGPKRVSVDVPPTAQSSLGQYLYIQAQEDLVRGDAVDATGALVTPDRWQTYRMVGFAAANIPRGDYGFIQCANM